MVIILLVTVFVYLHDAGRLRYHTYMDHCLIIHLYCTRILKNVDCGIELIDCMLLCILIDQDHTTFDAFLLDLLITGLCLYAKGKNLASGSTLYFYALVMYTLDLYQLIIAYIIGSELESISLVDCT